MASRHVAKSFEIKGDSILVDGAEFPFALIPEASVNTSYEGVTVVTVGIYVDGPVNIDTSQQRRVTGRRIKDQPQA